MLPPISPWLVLPCYSNFEPVRRRRVQGFSRLATDRSPSLLTLAMVETAPARARLVRTYAALVGLPAVALFVILRTGETLPPAAGATPTPVDPAVVSQPGMGATVPLLLAQVIVVLVDARVVGLIVRRIGQPQVVGEMLAGIALGPSVLGTYAPSVSNTLFPASSLGLLNALSQIGLLVFMFLVGLELDPKVVRDRGRAAIVISHASIVAPFLLGALLALQLYPGLAGERVTFTAFALFMGAAMSVTAFLGGSVAYATLVLTVGRRLLRRLETRYARQGRVTQGMIAVLMVAMLASALVTEWLGVSWSS